MTDLACFNCGTTDGVKPFSFDLDLPALAGCPLRPLARRHAARKATELTILSAELGAVGLHSESAELARIATRWRGIANDLGERR